MTESEYRTFEALIFTLDALLDNLAAQGRLRTDFRPVAEPHPLFHQLERGFCLELAPNRAINFWTPWGDLNAGISDLPPEAVPPLAPEIAFRDFTVDESAPRRIAPRSLRLAIHRAGRLVLPQPKLRPLEGYRTPEDSRGLWSEINRLFCSRRRCAA